MEPLDPEVMERLLAESGIRSDERGGRIRQCRLAAKMTRDTLAKRMGITRPLLREIETGEVWVSLVVAAWAAEKLGVPPATIICPDSAGVV